MTHDAAIQAYCNEIGKKLDLPAKRRRDLLDGLRQELEERFPSEEDLDVQTLHQSVGSPEVTAEVLLESVGREEREQYRSRKRLLTRLAFGGLALLLVAMVAFYFYMDRHQVAFARTTIIEYVTVER